MPPDPNDIQAKLQAIYRQQAELYDSLTAALEKELDRIITETLAALMERMRNSLALDGNKIARTPQNLIVLTRLDTEFQALVKKYGYRRAITAFVSKFPKQFDLLAETFALLSYSLDQKWLRSGTLFRASDLKVLNAQQLVAKDTLNDLPAQTGIRAKNKVVQLAGSGTLADAQAFLHTAFDQQTGYAKTLGTTAMATFWRVASAQVYDRIQEGQKAPLTYSFAGPLDSLCRPLCRKLETESRAGKTWTRKQIDQIDNRPSGPGPGSSFTLASGYNCRHQWVLSVSGSDT